MSQLAGDTNYALKDLLSITRQIVVTFLGAEEPIAAQAIASIKPFDYPPDRSVEGNLASLPLSLAESFAGSEKRSVQMHKLEKTLRRS